MPVFQTGIRENITFKHIVMGNYRNGAFFKHLKQTIETRDTLAGKLFDAFIEAMIILSLVCFSLGTLPHLKPEIKAYMRIFDFFVIVVFTIEYLARIFVSDRKLKYIFSFFGLVDLIAILPFYLQTGLDLRSVRSFRLLRLLRLVKLLRYNTAVFRLRMAFKSIREELLIFFSITLVLIYIVSVGIYYFEHNAQPEVFSSVFDSIWFAVVSLTTVGYGDITPITSGGRVFTSFILILSLGIVAIPTGLFASALTKQKSLKKMEEEEKKADTK